MRPHYGRGRRGDRCVGKKKGSSLAQEGPRLPRKEDNCKAIVASHIFSPVEKRTAASQEKKGQKDHQREEKKVPCTQEAWATAVLHCNQKVIGHDREEGRNSELTLRNTRSDPDMSAREGFG